MKLTTMRHCSTMLALVKPDHGVCCRGVPSLLILSVEGRKEGDEAYHDELTIDGLMIDGFDDSWL